MRLAVCISGRKAYDILLHEASSQTRWLNFGGVRYWDIGTSPKTPILTPGSILKSDSRLRPDRLALEGRNVASAQDHKVFLHLYVCLCLCLCVYVHMYMYIFAHMYVYVYRRAPCLCLSGIQGSVIHGLRVYEYADVCWRIVLYTQVRIEEQQRYERKLRERVQALHAKRTWGSKE